MNINWTAFTPTAALIGGMLLGLASVLLMSLNGRIAGITGIMGGLIRPYAGDISWRVMFIIGVILAPMIYTMLYGALTIEVTNSVWVLAISGLIVGYGTRLGSGCTSGHGICGNARFSLRSMVSTIVFMSAGILIVAIFKQLAV